MNFQTMRPTEAPKSNYLASIWGPGFPVANTTQPKDSLRFSEPNLHDARLVAKDYELNESRAFNTQTPTRVPRLEQPSLMTPPQQQKPTLHSSQSMASLQSMSAQPVYSRAPGTSLGGNPSFNSSGYAPQARYTPPSFTAGHPSHQIDQLELDSATNAREDTIGDLKLQIEALVTALAMSQATPPSQMHASEGLEVANRMIDRLKSLREENAYLANLTTGQHAARIEAVNAQLKAENGELKKRIAELTS